MLVLPTSLYSPSQRAAIDSKESCHTMLKDVSSFREELESQCLFCNESASARQCYVSLKLKLAVAIASYRQSIARFLLESIHTELNYGIKLIRGNNGRLASHHCCTAKLLQETKCEEPLLLFLVPNYAQIQSLPGRIFQLQKNRPGTEAIITALAIVLENGASKSN